MAFSRRSILVACAHTAMVVVEQLLRLNQDTLLRQLPSDIQGGLRMLQRSQTRKGTFAAAVGVGGLAIWLTLGLAPTGAQSEVDSQLYMAGIDSPKDARSFLEHLKAAARNRDNGAVAALVHYPLAMYDNGKVIHIYRSRKALLKNFSAVFTPKVLKAIGDAKYETLFVRVLSAMIGDGEIWFVGWDGQVLIKTINP